MRWKVASSGNFADLRRRDQHRRNECPDRLVPRPIPATRSRRRGSSRGRVRDRRLLDVGRDDGHLPAGGRRRRGRADRHPREPAAGRVAGGQRARFGASRSASSPNSCGARATTRLEPSYCATDPVFDDAAARDIRRRCRLPARPDVRCEEGGICSRLGHVGRRSSRSFLGSAPSSSAIWRAADDGCLIGADLSRVTFRRAAIERLSSSPPRVPVMARIRRSPRSRSASQLARPGSRERPRAGRASNYDSAATSSLACAISSASSRRSPSSSDPRWAPSKAAAAPGRSVRRTASSAR
jgi:hypothetical protein